MHNLKKQIAAFLLCFAMLFTSVGSVSAIAPADAGTYVPLYWVDGNNNYINGIDTPFEQSADNGGCVMELYYKTGDTYTAIDAVNFANIQKDDEIGYFAWVESDDPWLVWNTENIESAVEGSAVFTVGDKTYCIKLKVNLPTTEEKAENFIDRYMYQDGGSYKLMTLDALFVWEQDLDADVKTAVNTRLAPAAFADSARTYVQDAYATASDFSDYVSGNTISVGNANTLREGGSIYPYLSDAMKSAVDSAANTNFASLKDAGTTLTYADVAAAAAFIDDHLIAKFGGVEVFYLITKANADSNNDELYVIRNGETAWNALSALQKTAVNKALANADASAMTYEAMLAYAKEADGGGSGGSIPGTPFDTSEVREFTVDDVVAMLHDDKGNFNFTKSNPNLDTIQEVWLLYRCTVEYGNHDSICKELDERFGDTKYGPNSDRITVAEGYHRVSQVGWFFYGQVSTIGDNPVYRWEALVENCDNVYNAMFVATASFSYEGMLTKDQQKLLDTYLETSIHEGFQTAKNYLQKSEDAVEEFRKQCLTDAISEKLITEENVMLAYWQGNEYADNSWRVIMGEAIYREVFNGKQREQIDAICESTDGYYGLLRLAQAYFLIRFDDRLTFENAYAVVGSKGKSGNDFNKLINDALMYDKFVKIAIAAEVTDSLPANETDPLDAALATSEELEGYSLENYQDVSVKVYIDDELVEDLEETNGKISFEVGQAEEGVDYKLLRNHDGTVDILDVEETADGTLVAKSDKFSAYALVSTGGGSSVPTIQSPTANVNQITYVGQTATLTVQAANATAYQWYVDRGSGFKAIDGATDASYTTSAVKMENSGYRYYCKVSNGIGAVYSPIFTLIVTENADIPATGDNNLLGLFTALMVGSFMLLVLTSLPKRKRD